MTELLSWRINKLTGWQEWWVGKGGELVSLMSWWLDEIISRWVFQFVCWWAYTLMSWLVRDLLFFRELISQWVDLSYTSYMRRMFILCWYHKITYSSQFIETLKVKTTLNKETDLPRIRNPKTPYIYISRACTREKSRIATRPHPTLPRAKT